MSEITRFCEANVIEKEFANLYLTFLVDTQKWVKITAYKRLGLFISKFEGLHLNERLFDHYMMMIEPKIYNMTNKDEANPSLIQILVSCAFYFPAVLKSVGIIKWNSLYKLLTFLFKQQKSVRRSLANSLHEIAKLIGPDMAEEYLIKILGSFLKDPGLLGLISDSNIKFGAIKHLTSFLEVFNSQKKEDLIDVFLNIQKEQHKWRIRSLIAKQIEKLVSNYSKETVFRIISPISFKLCNDIVYEVRVTAAKKIYSLLKKFEISDEIYVNCVIENIKGFSASVRFTQRQTFLIMCQNLMKDSELFMKEFAETFYSLAKDDKIVNVRITSGLVLLRHLNKTSFHLNS